MNKFKLILLAATGSSLFTTQYNLWRDKKKKNSYCSFSAKDFRDNLSDHNPERTIAGIALGIYKLRKIKKIEFVNDLKYLNSESEQKGKHSVFKVVNCLILTNR